MRARTQIDAGREVAELDGVNAARRRPTDVVLALQRSAGNAAVASFLGRQHHPDGGTPDGGMSVMPQVDPAGRRQVFDIPVMLTAEPVDGGTSDGGMDGGMSGGPDGGAPVCLPPPLASTSSSSSSTVPGMGAGGVGAATANMAAHGAHGWGGPARLGTWQYWSPMVPGTGPRAGVIVERAVNEIPRDLSPRILGEIAARRAGGTSPLSWSSGHMDWARFSEADLVRVPDLVRRANVNPASLTDDELRMLASMAEVHIGGSTPGTPFASYATPGADVSMVGARRWRVQVEIDPNTALNVSDTNTPISRLLQVENAAEREVMVVTDDGMRILSVEATSASGLAAPSTGARTFAMRNAGAIRWGGRAVVFVSLAYSGYRIASAEEHERGRVVGEEVGGQVLGWAGGVAAGALCIGFGIATGGVGLIACGLVGGLIGGVGGTMLGGAIGGEFDSAPSSSSSSGGASSSSQAGPMCIDPGAAPGSASDPFNLGAPAQTVTVLDFLATPGITTQLQPGDYGTIASWPVMAGAGR